MQMLNYQKKKTNSIILLFTKKITQMSFKMMTKRKANCLKILFGWRWICSFWEHRDLLFRRAILERWFKCPTVWNTQWLIYNYSKSSVMCQISFLYHVIHNKLTAAHQLTIPLGLWSFQKFNITGKNLEISWKFPPEISELTALVIWHLDLTAL